MWRSPSGLWRNASGLWRSTLGVWRSPSELWRSTSDRWRTSGPWRRASAMWGTASGPWRRWRARQQLVHRASLGELAERWWRPPLALSATLFALSGPAHALGRIDAVFYASLAGVTLGAAAIPLGLMSLRYRRPESEEQS
jgi:hypothetical protein